VKAPADHGRWWRTLPAQGSDRGFGALHLRFSYPRFGAKACSRWTIFSIARRNDEREHGEYLTKRLILDGYDAMRISE
jgi:hypothetical protein